MTRSLLAVLFCIITSCSDDRETDLNLKEYVDLRTDIINNNYKEYAALRYQAIDSLQSWIDDSLSYVAFLIHYPSWQLDSMFFFNSDSSRFYTKLHSSSTQLLDDELDSSLDFGGAFIDGNWYFFQMGTVTYVSRGDWHHDPYEPLTFEELSYLAWRRAIPGLIYRREDGTIATRHESIDRMFFSTDQVYCRDPTTIRKCRDSFHIATLKRSLQSKLRKEEILEIQENIRNSKKPFVPPYKELTWWDRLWGKEDLLFDSEAWKERYNYKKEEEIQ